MERGWGGVGEGWRAEGDDNSDPRQLIEGRGTFPEQAEEAKGKSIDSGIGPACLRQPHLCVSVIDLLRVRSGKNADIVVLSSRFLFLFFIYIIFKLRYRFSQLSVLGQAVQGCVQLRTDGHNAYNYHAGENKKPLLRINSCYPPTQRRQEERNKAIDLLCFKRAFVQLWSRGGDDTEWSQSVHRVRGGLRVCHSVSR